jgi:SOS-response transcriptional repressor LexA
MSDIDTITTGENVCSLAAWRRTASQHKQELSILPAGSSFQIQILGDALTGQGIHHGDLIDCERVSTLAQGELGLLKTPYGLLLRLYHSDGTMIRLEPANSDYPTLCLPTSDVSVIARPLRLERWFTTFDEMEVAANGN